MYKRFFATIFVIFLMMIGCFCADASVNNNDLEVSNNYFSFSMPIETQGMYSVENIGNGIYISEKFSKISGEGGLAFALKLFKDPQDYADMDGYSKLGELTDKTGALYDMVLVRPDEVRYGEGEKIAENYNLLYDSVQKIEIRGLNGSKYVKNKGMKGADLYGDILKKYKKVFDENWTRVEQYEKVGMNTAYYYFFKPNEKLSDKIGYVYYDINYDGIDELIIGKITAGKFKGLVYDIYTMVDRKPQLVLSGSNIDRYFVCNDIFICNEKYLNKNETRLIVYGLNKNSTKLYVQNIFIKKPKEIKKLYSKTYNKFNLVPFSKYKN